MHCLHAKRPTPPVPCCQVALLGAGAVQTLVPLLLQYDTTLTDAVKVGPIDRC